MSEVDLKADVEAGQPEHTEVELEAMEAGWIPPERADALPEGKKHLTAEEYLERGSFFKKIETLKKKVEDQDKTIANLANHYEKVVESERQKAKREMDAQITRLKAEKAQALDQGDSARVVEIDEEMHQVRQEVRQQPRGEDPTFTNWKKENSWYQEDEFLTMEADVLGFEFSRRNLPLDAALTKITNHLKTKYPERFKTSARELPPSVEGSTPPVKSGKSFGEKDLTKEEREVFKNFERNGVIKSDADKQRYFQQVLEQRD